ncbi:hypothetical protein GGH92_009368, partial [Coemansia sp. RSA 2673]
MATTDLKLSNGVLMPAIGLGTWRADESGVLAQTIKTAVALGYRHIDCAKIYGNQREIGQALKGAGVPRSELFIVSKIYQNKHRPELVAGALDEILDELQLEYLDLLLMHWPAILDKMIPQCSIVPAVNQVEIHPYNQQTGLVKFCRQHGIAVTGYCPLGGTKISVMEDKFIQRVAEAHLCTPAQVALSWALARGIANLHQITLTSDEMRMFAKLDKNERKVDPGRSFKELEWVFHEDVADCP